MQAPARRLSVVSATSCARRRLIRVVRPSAKSLASEPMNIFTLLAALMLVVIGFATLVALAVVLFRARKQGLRPTLIRLTICCVPLAASVLLYAWLYGPSDLSGPSELREAYRSEFGSSPPSDVSDHHVRVASVGDWWGAWQKFRASSTTIDALLIRFEPTDRQAFISATDGPNAPKWWTPDGDAIVGYFVASEWHKGSLTSKAYIGVDHARSVIYFFHDET